jgi:hypothetical protein
VTRVTQRDPAEREEIGNGARAPIEESPPMIRSSARAGLALAVLGAALVPGGARAVPSYPGAVRAIAARSTPRLDPTPVVHRAQWNGRREILGVLGSGAPRGASVEILDAASGLRLATATADQRGRFQTWLRMEAPTAPCAVRARVAELVSEARPVDRGPGRCRPAGSQLLPAGRI